MFLGKENIFRYLVAFQKICWKIFSWVCFCSWKCSKNTFSTYFSHFISFQTHITITIPIYKPKKKKKSQFHIPNTRSRERERERDRERVEAAAMRFKKETSNDDELEREREATMIRSVARSKGPVKVEVVWSSHGGCC